MCNAKKTKCHLGRADLRGVLITYHSAIARNPLWYPQGRFTLPCKASRSKIASTCPTFKHIHNEKQQNTAFENTCSIAGAALKASRWSVVHTFQRLCCRFLRSPGSLRLHLCRGSRSSGSTADAKCAWSFTTKFVLCLSARALIHSWL